jgi:formate dehydrogenase alpha subunit
VSEILKYQEEVSSVSNITLTIDGIQTTVPKGTTVLEAARKAGSFVPTLCHDPELSKPGACRLCVVEIKGARNLSASCVTEALEGMVVETASPAVIEARKTILELMLSNHPEDCLLCHQAGDCKLQDYAYFYDVRRGAFTGDSQNYDLEDDNLFIVRNMNKCILCGKCIRACEEKQGRAVINFAYRGFRTKVTTAMDQALADSVCVSCGSCVAVCPTGALTEKSMLGKGRKWEVEKVRTTCPFCGVGCNFDLNVRDGKVIGVTSNPDSPVNGPDLCVKGRFGIDYVHSPKRLTRPLIRENGEFVETSWEEALDLVASRLGDIKSKFGSDAIAALSSARCTNEDNYVLQKFIRAVCGTNNVDHCARTCHAPTVAGLAASFGSGAMTNSIEDILHTDLLFVIGANPTEAHPMVGAKMLQAVRKGTKLVVVDPRRIELADKADFFLQIKSGTDIPLMNGLMHIIIKEGLHDRKFVEERTEGFEDLRATVEKYTPGRVSELTGVPENILYEVARLYAKAPNAMICYTLGITEHICGTYNVMSTANMAMLTGHIGRLGSGVSPLRGQNNVQGACDMGALPGDYHGYQKVANPEVRAKFEKAWAVKLDEKPGMMIPAMMDAAVEGRVKAMYIMGEDPVLSDPNANYIKQAMEALDFLVVQEIFMSETAKFADVVLPGASFAEKDGTFTNAERRVQRVRKAIEPIADSRPDWQIVCELARRMGFPMDYGWPGDIWDEIAALSPLFTGINYDRMDAAGMQWPCPAADHPGTRILHTETFTRGLGLLKGIEHIPPAELPDEEYPFLLSTGRILSHYNVTTRQSPALSAYVPGEAAMVHPMDAANLGVANGDRLRVTSRRGSVTTGIRITDRVQPGMIWMSLHHASTPTNELTVHAFDPISQTGEYKIAAVRLERMP